MYSSSVPVYTIRTTGYRKVVACGSTLRQGRARVLALLATLVMFVAFGAGTASAAGSPHAGTASAAGSPHAGTASAAGSPRPGGKAHSSRADLHSVIHALGCGRGQGGVVCGAEQTLPSLEAEGVRETTHLVRSVVPGVHHLVRPVVKHAVAAAQHHVSSVTHRVRTIARRVPAVGDLASASRDRVAGRVPVLVPARVSPGVLPSTVRGVVHLAQRVSPVIATAGRTDVRPVLTLLSNAHLTVPLALVNSIRHDAASLVVAAGGLVRGLVGPLAKSLTSVLPSGESPSPPVASPSTSSAVRAFLSDQVGVRSWHASSAGQSAPRPFVNGPAAGTVITSGQSGFVVDAGRPGTELTGGPASGAIAPSPAPLGSLPGGGGVGFFVPFHVGGATPLLFGLLMLLIPAMRRRHLLLTARSWSAFLASPLERPG